MSGSGVGRTLFGGVKHQGNVSMLTPEQQQALSQIVPQGGQLAAQNFQKFLGPQSQEDMQSLFQQSYVDPAMMAYERNVLPAIQERFGNMNASSSSALNQALAQSASDLSTSLGSQFGQFSQNQNTQALQAMQLLQPYLTGQTFSPMIQQQQGILGPLLGAAGSVGAGMMMSSKEVKENIREYEKGLHAILNMEVKQYDYKMKNPNAKDRVGLIAEDMPKELTGKKDGILHVDLYGVIGVLINAVKELSDKIDVLEGE
jgi:hypothetical protein